MILKNGSTAHVGRENSNQGVKREFVIFFDRIMGKIVLIKYSVVIIKRSRGTLLAMCYEQESQHNSKGHWLTSLKRWLGEIGMALVGRNKKCLKGNCEKINRHRQETTAVVKV